MSKQIRKTDLVGDYWEDENGKKIRIKEDNWGNIYEEDEEGKKTNYRNDALNDYRENDGDREYRGTDFLGNKYYESKSGKRITYKKDAWGNEIRETDDDNEPNENNKQNEIEDSNIDIENEDEDVEYVSNDNENDFNDDDDYDDDDEEDDDEDDEDDADEHNKIKSSQMDNYKYDPQKKLVLPLTYYESNKTRPPELNKHHEEKKEETRIDITKKQQEEKAQLGKEVEHVNATNNEYPQLMIQKRGDDFLYCFFVKNQEKIEKQNWLFADHYSEGIALIGVKRKGILMYGYVDVHGEKVTPPDYNFAMSFSEGFAVVGKKNFWGKVKLFYIDKMNNRLFRHQFDDAYSFTEAMAAIKIKGKWGFINTDGIIKIQPKYRKVESFSQGFSAVEIDESKSFQQKFVFINKNGENVSNNVFSYVGSFYNGLAPVCINGKMGYINLDFEYVIKPEYIFATTFNNGFAVVSTLNENFLIDVHNQKVKKIGNNLSIFHPPSEELIIAKNKNKKLGIINFEGQSVTDFEFDLIIPFKFGIAYVQKGTHHGYLNKSGERILIREK